MDGISGLVAHVGDVVAFFDEVLAETSPLPSRPRVSFSAMQRAHREGRVDTQRTETWVESVEGVESVSVRWSMTSSVFSGRRWPALAFNGTPPPNWTPARAELEARWSSRDAIVNAVRKVTREGTPAHEVADRVAEVYGGWLERRADLVDGRRFRPLRVAAIHAVRNWAHAAPAVDALAQEWRRLFDDAFVDETGDAAVSGYAGFTTASEWKVFRGRLVSALENARDYGAALAREAEGDGGCRSLPRSEVGVEDERSRAIRDMPDNARSLSKFLFDKEAFERPTGFTIPELAVELNLTDGEVKGACKWLRKHAPKLIEAVPGRNGRHWLSPDGKRMAEGIDADTCVQLCLATAAGNRHKSARA